MTHGYPYWQFCCDRWLTGKIASLPLDEQGLFLHFCMMAWVAQGAFNMCSTLVQRKFNRPQEWVDAAIACMLDCGILVKDGEAYRIKFIDEQLAALSEVRVKRSLAGKASAEARAPHTPSGKKSKGKKRREGCSTRVEHLFKDDDTQYVAELRKLYSWIDIDKELVKMRGWMLSHSGRQLTRRFVVNWLNKVDKPLTLRPASSSYGPDTNYGMGKDHEHERTTAPL